MVEKLGGGQEASRSMGELLSGVGSLLASDAAVDQVCGPRTLCHLIVRSLITYASPADQLVTLIVAVAPSMTDMCRHSQDILAGLLLELFVSHSVMTNQDNFGALSLIGCRRGH